MTTSTSPPPACREGGIETPRRAVPGNLKENQQMNLEQRLAKAEEQIAELRRHLEEVERKIVAGGMIFQKMEPTPEQVEEQRLRTFGEIAA
jgi:hypothetical protein